MKNIMLVLISILSFQISLPINGQSALTKPNNFARQISLSSAEMINFMRIMVAESDLLINVITPYLKADPYEINIEITISYEVVKPLDMVSRYWNEYALNLQIARDFFTSNNQYITGFYELLSDSETFIKRMEDPFFKKYQSREFVDQKQISQLTQPAINNWMDLSDQFLQDRSIVNKRKLYASLGNWKFNVGPGGGWDY